MATLRYGGATVGVIIVASGFIAAYAALADESAPQAARVEVPGVSSERLQKSGITLVLPPQGVAASISEQSALEIAAGPGRTKVKSSALAQLYDSSSVPPIDRLVWVVSYDTIGSPRSGGGGFGPGGEHTETPIAWSLAFIDAVTGELLFVQEGSDAEVAAATQAGTSAPPPPVSVDGVSDAELAQAGVVITAPRNSPNVTADAAVTTAISTRPGLRDAKQTLHAHLSLVDAGQPIDRDVWVVSFDVEGLPWLGGGHTANHRRQSASPSGG